jgi:hypothetical protein
MTESTDDDALRWDGDDALAAPARPAPLIDDRQTDEGGRASGGSVALLAIGILGGVAVLETVFWIRSLFTLSISSSVDVGSGSAVEIVAFVLNIAGRVLAVAAPVVWFAIIAWRVRVPSRRLALLVLGAVLLVPWPAILAAA